VVLAGRRPVGFRPHRQLVPERRRQRRNTAVRSADGAPAGLGRAAAEWEIGRSAECWTRLAPAASLGLNWSSQSAVARQRTAAGRPAAGSPAVVGPAAARQRARVDPAGCAGRPPSRPGPAGRRPIPTNRRSARTGGHPAADPIHPHSSSALPLVLVSAARPAAGEGALPGRLDVRSPRVSAALPATNEDVRSAAGLPGWIACTRWRRPGM
jgi:hypothetical protein